MVDPIPDGLIEAIRNNRCVLFAGSGLSRGLIEYEGEKKEQSLPTWGDLLGVLIQRAKLLRRIDENDALKLDNAVTEGKFLFVAEAVKGILGTHDFENSLEEIFRNPHLEFTPRHELITRIPFAAVITTNYDKLIEDAYADRDGKIPPVYTFKNVPDIISALYKDKFFILKAHGDIDQKDTIILSERNYRDLIYREPGYRATLNTIFITKTVLFLGAGLVDKDVALVLESVSETFRNNGSIHYAFVPWGDATDAEARHWRDYFGINLIRYTATKDHPEVDTFLHNLYEKRILKGPFESSGIESTLDEDEAERGRGSEPKRSLF